MFQNISKNTQDVFEEGVEYTQDKKGFDKREFLKRTFSLQNCIIYVISFMVAMAGGDSTLLTIAPFGFAMIAAAVGAEVPVMMVCVSSLLGATIKFGGSSLLTYLFTILVFLACILIKRPAEAMEDYELNEKKKVGAHIAISVFIVQAVQMLFKTFYVYDLLYSIMLAISTFIMYKVFVNSLIVFKEFTVKKVFSIEEVIGASILAIIAISALGNLSILGFSIRNVLSILVVLVLGWKNGMLVGATGGLTVGPYTRNYNW